MPWVTELQTGSRSVARTVSAVNRAALLLARLLHRQKSTSRQFLSAFLPAFVGGRFS